MSYTKIWIHAVFGTKRRHPYLTGRIKKEVINHIFQNAVEKGITISKINGISDHLHCLIRLHPKQCPADVLQLIKGESGHWLNENKLCKTKFAWSVRYYAVSISEKDVEAVKRYICNQEYHHRKKSFKEEVEELFGIPYED
jgi:putative transposase